MPEKNSRAKMILRAGSSGNQSLLFMPMKYRQAILRKLNACHRHIQVGIIAQGLLQYLASVFPALIWNSFGSWIRAIRPNLPPSEMVAEFLSVFSRGWLKYQYPREIHRRSLRLFQK